MVPAQAEPLPIAARCLRTLLASNVRGATRLSVLSARLMPKLRRLEVPVGPQASLFIDLRITASHHLLLGVLHEDHELQTLSQIVKTGDTVWDIGAHFGLYSVLLSQLVGEKGKVFAFEPNTLLLPSLEKTVADYANITLSRTALSNASGPTSFFIPLDFSAASLANWTETKERSIEIRVEQKRADDLLAQNLVSAPSFIKCDVEGAELLVFQGAKSILDSPTAPVILFEVNSDAMLGFEQKNSSSITFLRSLSAPKYKIFQFREGGQLTALQGPIESCCNLLAIPENRLAELTSKLEIQ